MVGVMVRGENPPASFDILPDEHLIDQRFPPLAAEPSTIHGSGALEELPVDYQAQRPKRLHALDKPQDADYLQGTHPLAKAPSRGPRRRPPIGIETFEPLEKPQEEAPTCLQKNDVPSLAAEHFTSPQAPASGSPSSLLDFLLVSGLD